MPAPVMSNKSAARSNPPGMVIAAKADGARHELIAGARNDAGIRTRGNPETGLDQVIDREGNRGVGDVGRLP